MSLDLPAEERPLQTVDELVAYFRAAERPPSEHRIGLEHEKLVFRGAAPVPYEGEGGIGALLHALADEGLEAFKEGPGAPTIALTEGAATISLEPGGQLELSGAPAFSARQVHAENLKHLERLTRAGESLGLSFVALGYRPFGTVAEQPWMPKARYRAMRETLGSRGALALDMMLMTATAQVSLDWRDEADCARKVGLAARMAPVVLALYANSPLKDGKPTGYLSYRSRVWSEVDSARCGYLPSMLDGGFSYRAYVAWALDVPLLFLRRDGQYLKPRMTFGELLRGGFDGKPALYADWIDHLSTLFPEVRIKRVLEFRSADCNGAAMTGALAALFRGLLYDAAAMDELDQLLPKLSFEAHLRFHDEARKKGLEGALGRTPLAALARELVEIARRGLQRLDAQDAPLLEPLRALAASGRSPARAVLDDFDRGLSPEALLAARRVG